ncbi:iron-containing alcohol dehydrogenase [Saccharothrix sp. NRRL B-16348]|uniref:iron-containing alcohol dehydrogenase n=1 Tax=Saccharothrix sp. NRRL B-16348 TaxID=1415542 RepID=UPI0003C9CD52|nr:iron-containing alcohol dehydrogenase [Saccharothrix sp. NRRL B-16348]AGZ94297.1 alcohol dehydrogenase iron-containing [Saccharothrix sp. NRRL B-16348]
MIFDVSLPTAVVFGAGRFAELGARTRALGGRALLVCGRSAAREHGLLAAAASSLAGAGVAVTVFDQVSEGPMDTEVDAAVGAGLAASCDVVVGLGGGSAIDAAKAAAVGLRAGPVGPLVGAPALDRDPRAVPVVAVPTVAGSGAEVTKGAIITDTSRRLRAGIRGDDLFPRVALVDPDLLVTVPAHVAVASGFDAFTHLVEGCVARRSDDAVRWAAERALPLLVRRLPEIAAGALGAEQRADLALASLLGGFAVANAGTCLPHRLQQAMGSVPRVRVSHGRGLALLYPAWLAHATVHAGERFAAVARLMGVDDVADGVDRLTTAIGVGAPPDSFGFTSDDLPALVGGVTGNVDNDPIPNVGETVIRDIYLAAFRR